VFSDTPQLSCIVVGGGRSIVVVEMERAAFWSRARVSGIAFFRRRPGGRWTCVTYSNEVGAAMLLINDSDKSISGVVA